MMTTHLDTREFDAALKFYASKVKKDTAHIVNRQSLNVIIKAIQETPRGEKTKINAALGYVGDKQSKIFKKVKGKNRRVYSGKTKKIPDLSTPLVYKILNKKYKHLKRGQGVRKFLSTRRGAIGYLRAAWWPAAKVFDALKTGLKSPSGTNQASKKFPRMAGGGTGASEGFKSFATLFTAAAGSATVGREILSRALNLAAKDMREYIEKKFRETAKKVAKVV